MSDTPKILDAITDMKNIDWCHRCKRTGCGGC